MATELKTLDAVTRQIEVLQRAAQEIRSCRDIASVKKVADWAQMVRLAAERVGASIEAQKAAAEVAMRARRWEGTLLREMKEAGERRKAGRPRPKASNGDNGNSELPLSQSLEDLGISRIESSRAQAIAAIPDEAFDAALERGKMPDGEITTGAFVALGRSAQAADKPKAPSRPPDLCPTTEEIVGISHKRTRAKVHLSNTDEIVEAKVRLVSGHFKDGTHVVSLNLEGADGKPIGHVYMTPTDARKHVELLTRLIDLSEGAAAPR
jgi:hypothetical protein